jgi:hypothetical protein
MFACWVGREPYSQRKVKEATQDYAICTSVTEEIIGDAPSHRKIEQLTTVEA